MRLAVCVCVCVSVTARLCVEKSNDPDQADFDGHPIMGHLDELLIGWATAEYQELEWVSPPL